jgi:hypothetical protein
MSTAKLIAMRSQRGVSIVERLTTKRSFGFYSGLTNLLLPQTLALESDRSDTQVLFDRQDFLLCCLGIVTEVLALLENSSVQGQCDMGEAVHNAFDYAVSMYYTFIFNANHLAFLAHFFVVYFDPPEMQSIRYACQPAETKKKEKVIISYTISMS